MSKMYSMEKEDGKVVAIKVYDLQTGQLLHVFIIRKGCDKPTAERIKMFLKGEPIEIGMTARKIREEETVLTLIDIKCPIPGCLATFRNNRERNKHFITVHGGLREVLKRVFPEGFTIEQVAKKFFVHESEDKSRQLTERLIDQYLKKGIIRRIGKNYYEVVKLFNPREEDIDPDLLRKFIESERGLIVETRRY